METASDRELWASAAGGEPDAFGALFQRHGRAVYNYCFRRTADWAVAEDLSSVVFLEAWRRRKGVRLHGESALPWLYGIATNVLRNRSRALRRYRAALGRIPLGHEPDFAADIVDRVGDEQQMRRVLEAIQLLPKRDQDVLALCVWSELTYEEAAVALDLPVGTVRSRLSRARARLRDDAEFSLRRRAVPNESE